MQIVIRVRGGIVVDVSYDTIGIKPEAEVENYVRYVVLDADGKDKERQIILQHKSWQTDGIESAEWDRNWVEEVLNKVVDKDK